MTYCLLLLLLGDVGGTLGLFLGASVLTLAEVVEWFFVKIKNFLLCRKDDADAEAGLAGQADADGDNGETVPVGIGRMERRQSRPAPKPPNSQNVG